MTLLDQLQRQRLKLQDQLFHPAVQPTEITVISKNTLTQAIGRLVALWQPVMRPSLGPGPRFAIKYIPLAIPTTNVPSSGLVIFALHKFLGGEGMVETIQ
jgi:hypothetical protein